MEALITANDVLFVCEKFHGSPIGRVFRVEQRRFSQMARFDCVDQVVERSNRILLRFIYQIKSNQPRPNCDPQCDTRQTTFALKIKISI